MTVLDPARQAADLSIAWDALLRGREDDATALDPALRDTVTLLRSTGTSPALRPERVDAIWDAVLAGGVSSSGATATAAAAPPVGAHAVPALPQNDGRIRTRSGRAGVVAAWVTGFAWIVVSGFLGGFVAGVGGRLAMRLSGLLTPDRNRFIRTENGNVVGEITLDGSVSLGLLGGGVGVVVVLLYLCVRDRLPGTGWRRSLLFSVLLLLVFGYVVMDPENPDYRAFGPPWLNVLTFSGLYLVMGFCTSQAYELGRRYRGPSPRLRGHRVVQLSLLIVSLAISALGSMIVVASVVFTSVSGLPVLGLVVVAWLMARLAIHPPVLDRPPLALLRPWGLMVAPALVGVILTAGGIAGILIDR